MILEVGILNVVPGQESAFEETLKVARPLIAATPGFESINIHRCVETPHRYLLLVTWTTLEDHTIGFRKSDRFRNGAGSFITFTIRPRLLSIMPSRLTLRPISDSVAGL